MQQLGESRLRGSIVEQLRTSEIENNVEVVREYQRKSAELEVTLSDYMGGRSSIHSGGGKIDYFRIIKKLGHSFTQLQGSLAKAILIPGIDYSQLLANPNRIKYYCSFGEGITPEQQESLLADLIKGSQERHLSLQLKTQDHNYDGLDIYSWNPEMAVLISELFIAHRETFNPVPRIFHAGITADSISCIGWVQEPLSWAYVSREVASEVGAHSDRMSELGKKIGARDITVIEFSRCCSEVGVKAEKPYLLSTNRLKAN